MILGGTNAASGGTTLSMNAAAALTGDFGTDGTLQLNSSTASLGSGQLTLTGGILNNNTGGTDTLPNYVTISSGATLSLAGSSGFTFSGLFDSIAGAMVLVLNNSATISGLVIMPTGTLTLDNTNGPAGTLTLTNTDSDFQANVIEIGGNLTLGGYGSIINAPSFTLATGSGMTIDDSGTDIGNRVNSTATFSLNGGSLTLLGATQRLEYAGRHAQCQPERKHPDAGQRQFDDRRQPGQRRRVHHPDKRRPGQCDGERGHGQLLDFPARSARAEHPPTKSCLPPFPPSPTTCCRTPGSMPTTWPRLCRQRRRRSVVHGHVDHYDRWFAIGEL